jgi:hypothetical protein
MKWQAPAFALVVTLVFAAPVGATSGGLNVREKAWVHSLTPLISSIGKASSEIVRDSQHADVFVKGSNTQVRLVFALAIYENCTATVRAKGLPPTRRLRLFRKALLLGCGAYGKAASQLATGIDQLDATLIRSAASLMQRGTAYMNLANRRLLALA